MKKLIVALLATAGLLVGAGAQAGISLCYDVQVTAAGTEVANEQGCQTADVPAPPA
jgi:hypothetical protein